MTVPRDMAGTVCFEVRATDPAGSDPDDQLARLRRRVGDLIHFERSVVTNYGCTHVFLPMVRVPVAGGAQRCGSPSPV